MDGGAAPFRRQDELGAFDAVWGRPMSGEPDRDDPDEYKVVFENDRVRVLEYRDKPGDRTSPHHHPD